MQEDEEKMLSEVERTGIFQKGLGAQIWARPC